ncbi:Ig-like domain-containing protein [Herbidospora cretacea]|uniref:Ig-like domain-containing protein n=1 Tax=Herbidospora cretacea TaxID=28444 RepID=UPI0004C42717|nr:Ig-like domain-containing protein [Herbidospora cretacea]
MVGPTVETAKREAVESGRGTTGISTSGSDLPTPKPSGNTATYASVYGRKTDLVVTTTPTGFRQKIVIRERPKGPVTFEVPVELPKGRSFGTSASGQPTLLDQCTIGREPCTSPVGGSDTFVNDDLKFPESSPNSAFHDSTVENADLILWNHLSNDCGDPVGAGIVARRITSQPSVTSAGQDTETAGYSPTCPSGEAPATFPTYQDAVAMEEHLPLSPEAGEVTSEDLDALEMRRYAEADTGIDQVLPLEGESDESPDDPSVGDGTPPSVAETMPADGAVDVPVEATVTATFTEQVTGAGLVLRDAGGTLVPGAKSDLGEYGATTLTSTPDEPLEIGTTYTASITGGSDIWDNVMSPYAWSFTTAGPDTTAPTVTSTNPAVPQENHRELG